MGAHWQVDWRYVSVWIGVRRRAWVVGVQASLHDRADAPSLSLAAMLGPFYVGVEVAR